MKKVLSLCALALAMLLVLGGCGATQLPEGMDAEVIKEDAREFLDAVNQEDYAMVEYMFGLDSPDAAGWQELLEAKLAEYGEFKDFHEITFVNTESSTHGPLVVALVDSEYENARIIWQVSFTTDYDIVGLRV